MNRRWINSLPLRVKLIMPIWLLLTLGIAVVGLAVTHIVSKNLEQSLLSRTEILANGAASNLTAALAFEDRATGREQLAALSFDPDLMAARVTRVDGSEFVNLMRLPNDCFTMGAGIMCAKTPFTKVSRSISLGKDVLGHIDLFISRSVIVNERNRLILFLALGTVLLSLFSWMFAQLLHRIVSYPLASLHRSMSNMIRLGIHGHTIPIYHNDELGRLTDCFNDLVSSLEARDKQLNATFKQLEEKNSYINQVLDTMDQGLMVIAPGDQVTYYNPAAATHLALLGCDPNDLGQLLQILEPSSVMHQISEAIDAHQPLTGLELHHRHTNKLFRVSTHPMATAKHSLLQFEDITEQHVAEQRRKMAEYIFDQSKDATLVLSRTLAIEAQNAACIRLFGQHRHWSELSVDQHLRFGRPEVKALLSNGSHQWQTHMLSALGTSLPCQISVRTLTNRQGKTEAFVVSIIDKSAAMEIKRLNHLANHDPLTGLANRVRAQKQLMRSHDMGWDVHVLFVDLDGFKMVNDQFGHRVGDELLKVVARRLQASVAQSDMVARLSGDEFLLIINNAAEIEPVAERVLKKLSQSIIIDGARPQISASIGIRYWRSGEKGTFNAIIEQADKAMYAAKEAGKNRYAMSLEGSQESSML